MYDNINLENVGARQLQQMQEGMMSGNNQSSNNAMGN